ncbi:MULTISPECIES: zf-TFIIB domain-containing protein [Bradyrhizobium]|nr:MULTISPECIES: zf-TFIIB domain-containing protein [Bradyrhizobium]
MNNCPECKAELALLRVIPGRAEYWAMRCTGCGGIHLNIVEKTSPAC